MGLPGLGSRASGLEREQQWVWLTEALGDVICSARVGEGTGDLLGPLYLLYMQDLARLLNTVSLARGVKHLSAGKSSGKNSYHFTSPW